MNFTLCAMNDLAQQIEALLFLAGEAVSRKELARLTGQSRDAVATAVAELAEGLTEHGLTLVTTDTHVQLTTSSQVSSFVAQFLSTEERTLSAAAVETMALVAYRGPISRYEIEVIRGVDSRRIVHQLLLRGLIRPVSRAARPRQYVITEEFLSHLGVTEREQLPSFEELSSHEKILDRLKRDEQPHNEHS